MLRPLPFPDSERLVTLCELHESIAGFCIVSPPDLADWAQASRTLEGLALGRYWSFIWKRPDGAEGVLVGIATPGFLRVFGLEPQLGRFFVEDDLGSARRPVVVLSHGFWQERFGGDPGVLGNELIFAEGTFHVVGVMPPELKVPGLEGAELWVPLHFDPRAEERRPWRGFVGIGRLREGVSPESAQAELTALAERLAELHPESNEGWGVKVARLRDQVAEPVRSTLLTFLGAVALLLLIACANVANLLLARAAGRRRELALRTALGAGRGRLAAQLFVESLLLAAAGGACGLLLAGWIVQSFLPLSPRNIPRLDEVGLDATAVALAAGVTLLATLLFGLWPALRASATDPARALGGSGSGVLDRAAAGPRRALVVAEVALALVVSTAAGLLLRTYVATAAWDGGFDGGRLLTLSAFLPTDRYSGREGVELQHRLLREIEALPGVEAAGASSAGPLFGGREPDDFTVEGRADAETIVARWYDVDPNYFRTLGVALLRGRPFADSDHAEAPPVAIVNDTLARRLRSGGDVLGLRMKSTERTEPMEIVGVVADVRPDPPATTVEPGIYWPKRQYPRSATFFVVRTAVDPAKLIEPVRRRLLEIEPDLDLGRFATFGDLLSRKLERPRFNLLLLGLFAGAALVLAAGGTYGVMAHMVAGSVREIGLRMALGAGRREVLGQVLGRGCRLALAGIALGTLGALALTRWMSSLLFGVTAADPWTFAAAGLVLLAAVVLASFLPARRAAAVDPTAAMRCE
jgi:predicted permease